MSFNLMCSKNKILINYKYIKFEYGGKGTREHLRVPTRMRRGGGGWGRGRNPPLSGSGMEVGNGKPAPNLPVAMPT